MVTRYELEKELPRLREKYHKKDRKGKGELLDSLEKVTGKSRKHLIALLSLTRLPGAGRRPRSPSYGEGLIRILCALWKRSGRLSSERLKAQLPLLLPWAIKDGGIACTAEDARQLLRMSARQMTRRLAPYKRRLRKRAGCSRATTRSRTLRHLVPVSAARPPDCPPGLVEIDTVSHCGGDASGVSIWTLCVTDVATGMTALAPTLGVSAQQVVPALRHIIGGFPFRVTDIHSDNGSEFINNHLLSLVNQKGIGFTRSRPGKKNDNPHVEQKNWTCVRRAVGYKRYHTTAQLAQLQRVYRTLELVVNLFEPSAKLIGKTRDNAAVRRVYDTPATPIDRAAEQYRRRGKAVPAKVAKLLRLRKTLNPLQLYKQLEQEITDLKNLPGNTTHHNRKENPTCPNLNANPINLAL